MLSLTILAAIGLVAAKQCQNLTIPITVSARQGIFDAAALTPHSNVDVTNFILDLSQPGKNYTAAVLQGYNTTTSSFNISATYCAPNSGAPNVVQVLTHGIGFDRSYWDLSYNNYNYSYVNEAVDQYGFATFSYDRPGIGQSSHGEPVNEIQAYIEVAALKSLTDSLRAGFSGIPSFSKVVHVGHSFGSQHTYLLTAMYPNASDGIALTGFSQNGTFVPYFLQGGNFILANNVTTLKAYTDGYLAAGDASAVQNNFFSPGSFPPDLLQLATTTGQPVTVGELLTIGGEVATPNTFAGPALIITGERDLPYCGGNCLAPPAPGVPNIPSQSTKYLTNAKPLDIVIVPGAGHGLNLEYTHPYTFGTINNFFVQNGKGPANSTTQSVAPIGTIPATSRTSPAATAVYTGGASKNMKIGW